MIKGIQTGVSTSLANIKSQQTQPGLFAKLMTMLRQPNSGTLSKSQLPGDGTIRENRAKHSANNFTPGTSSKSQLPGHGSIRENRAQRSANGFTLQKMNTSKKPAHASSLSLPVSAQAEGSQGANTLGNKVENPESTDQPLSSPLLLTENIGTSRTLMTLPSAKGAESPFPAAIKTGLKPENTVANPKLKSPPLTATKLIAKQSLQSRPSAMPPNTAQESRQPTAGLNPGNNGLSMQLTKTAGNSGSFINPDQLFPSPNRGESLQFIPTIDKIKPQPDNKTNRLTPGGPKQSKQGTGNSHSGSRINISNGLKKPLLQATQAPQQAVLSSTSNNTPIQSETQPGVLSEIILQPGSQTSAQTLQSTQTGLSQSAIPGAAVEKTVPATDPHRTWPVAEAMQEIAQKSGNGRVRLEIRLDPPQLGKIRVSMESDANKKIHVHLLVDQVQSRQIIEQQLPILKQALQQQGLSLGEFSMQGGQQQEKGAAANLFTVNGKTRATPTDTENSAIQAAQNLQPRHGPGSLSIRI